MLGELDELQIDHLLLSQFVGRIGCTDGTRPYIVPVTYVYDGRYIIGQTNEGLKLNIMRKYPTVCFEVDAITNMANWQSVIISGKFEELHGKNAEAVREYMLNHMWPLLTSSTIHAHQHEASISAVDDTNRIKPIMYRISVDEKTGRFEKH